MIESEQGSYFSAVMGKTKTNVSLSSVDIQTDFYFLYYGHRPKE